uniref:Gypsy retrotransposon integrase-like protein 1 n=1 Tax=Podarcis muralis TaxID=64176 RepID=A0A670KNJ5_PODMU
MLQPTDPLPPKPVVRLTASLQLPNGLTMDVPITIDSGSNADFIGQDFVDQHDIQLLPATLPLQVVTVDGRELLGGQVVKQTPPMVMRLGNHREVISFNVTQLSDTPIVLGMSWLDKHSPAMAWNQRQLTFGSSYCAEHCILPQQEGEEEESQLQLGTLQAVPHKYADFLEVFCEKEADKLPPHRPYDCKIDLLPGAALPKGKLYSMSEDELQDLKEFIDHNLERGFIRESKAVGGSPVFFVKKKNTPQKRLVVDYRILNAVTKPSDFPMPRIDDLLATVRKGRVFTKLDLRGAYNLIRMREGDEWKTAMFTPLGTYEYRVMPFGLQNGSHCFQAFMHHVLAGLLYKKCVCFLDDILIFSESQHDHDRDVKEVLSRLQQHRLYAKLEKCQFDVSEVDFLGYRLSDKGLAMDSAKVRAVLDWKSPRNRKEVQRFVGFANFYRKFIKGFAMQTAAITDTLSSKKKKFIWTAQAEQSFQALKRLFASEEQLLHVNPSRPMRVETDASDRAVGAVLLQQDPQGAWRPGAFYSRKLTKSEQNYTIWDRELLAIHAAFKAWRHFLIGAKHTVQVRTDHKNLEHWRTARFLNQRQIRWAEFFADFDFRIEYVPGDTNIMADALSRKPQYLEEATPAAAMHIFAPTAWACASATVDLEAVRRALRDDSFARAKMAEAHRGTAATDEFQVRDGLLLRKGAIYVPGDDLRAKVLQQLHDAPTAGHFGTEKTIELVARDFWWPRMRGEVADYVARCDTCQRAKPVHRPPAGLLEPLQTPFEPWERVALDFVTDLPSSRGKTAVLVVVDLFSKMAHFIPCAKVATAEQTAKLFIDHVFKVHGLPRSILSDRGRQFISNFWQKLMGFLNVKINLASARHPQTNGQAERVNAIMQQYLRCYANQQPATWVDYLPLAEFAYNNTKHVSTGVTPFFANNGRHPRTFPGLERMGEGEPQTADAFASELQEVHDQLRRHLELAKHAYKVQADKHRRVGEEIQVGDWVWLAAQAVPARSLAKKKLGHKQLGPYQVEEQVNPVAFRLMLPEGSRMHPVFHRSVLTPYKTPHRFQEPGTDPSPLREGTEQGGVTQEESINEVTEILDSRWGEEGVEYLLAKEGFPASANSWVPGYALEEPLLKDEFHALFPHRPMPADFFDDWLFTPTLSASTFHGFDSDEEPTMDTRSPEGSPSGSASEPSYWWDDRPEEQWRRKWLEVPGRATDPGTTEAETDVDMFGEDLGFEHGGTEMEAEVTAVDERREEESEVFSWRPAKGSELYPAFVPMTRQHPAPAPEGGEGGKGGFEGGMDVRGSGAEARAREETESEGEESEERMSDDDDPRSPSLSSESEDSQKGAPVARAKGGPRGTPQEEGTSGGSEGSSWKSGPASPPERSGEEGRQGSSPGSSQQGGGHESGVTTPPSGSEETVKRKVEGWARAPSSNAREGGAVSSPEREPGPKARRKETGGSGGSASEESRREETTGGRGTQRRTVRRKRWSKARILSWCTRGGDSDGASPV